jgi:hypothetical protein
MRRVSFLFLWSELDTIRDATVSYFNALRLRLKSLIPRAFSQPQLLVRFQSLRVFFKLLKAFQEVHVFGGVQQTHYGVRKL